MAAGRPYRTARHIDPVQPWSVRLCRVDLTCTQLLSYLAFSPSLSLSLSLALSWVYVDFSGASAATLTFRLYKRAYVRVVETKDLGRRQHLLLLFVNWYAVHAVAKLRMR